MTTVIVIIGIIAIGVILTLGWAALRLSALDDLRAGRDEMSDMTYYREEPK